MRMRLLLLAAMGLAAVSCSSDRGVSRWETCGGSKDNLVFSSFTTSLQGSVKDGNIQMILTGEVVEPIMNGTFEFKFAHMEIGTEIDYKGPYDVCCDFFDSTKCEWLGEYPNGQRTSGCPVPAGPFRAVITRPMFIRAPGIYTSEVRIRTETGYEIGCVRSFADIQEVPQLPSSFSVQEGGDALVVVPSEEGEGEKDQRRGARKGLRRRGGGAEGGASAAETGAAGAQELRGGEGDQSKHVEVHVESEELLRQGRLWAGVYETVSECGAGCCCLHDEAVEVVWSERVKSGSVRATMSMEGRVAEGSKGACKGNERMNIRNFILGKAGNANVAEKVYCQGSCQTLRAVRSLGVDGRAVITVSNDQHQKCGEQVYVCKRGACTGVTEKDVLEASVPASMLSDESANVA